MNPVVFAKQVNLKTKKKNNLVLYSSLRIMHITIDFVLESNEAVDHVR